MKNLKLSLLVLFVAISLESNAQCSANCCSIDSNTEFAELAKDKSFCRSHKEPKVYKYSGVGKWIDYAVKNQPSGRAFEIKSNEKKDWVFVIHEWWGLNDYIQREAEKLAKELNVNVLCLDLYDGKVTSSRDSAGAFMQAAKKPRIESSINSALAYVGKEASISTIGWCFGGGWSLQTALMAGDQAKACVIYYGMPEKDIERLKTLNCPVLGLWAEQDAWITPKVVEDFNANLKSLGKSVQSFSYPEKHAFANPSNPQYAEEATGDAWKKAVEFLKKN